VRNLPARQLKCTGISKREVLTFQPRVVPELTSSSRKRMASTTSLSISCATSSVGMSGSVTRVSKRRRSRKQMWRWLSRTLIMKSRSNGLSVRCFAVSHERNDTGRAAHCVSATVWRALAKCVRTVVLRKCETIDGGDLLDPFQTVRAIAIEQQFHNLFLDGGTQGRPASLCPVVHLRISTPFVDTRPIWER